LDPQVFSQRSQLVKIFGEGFVGTFDVRRNLISNVYGDMPDPPEEFYLQDRVIRRICGSLDDSHHIIPYNFRENSFDQRNRPFRCCTFSCEQKSYARQYSLLNNSVSLPHLSKDRSFSYERDISCIIVYHNRYFRKEDLWEIFPFPWWTGSDSYFLQKFLEYKPYPRYPEGLGIFIHRRSSTGSNIAPIEFQVEISELLTLTANTV